MKVRAPLKFFPEKREPAAAGGLEDAGVWFGFTEDGVILRVAGSSEAPHPVLAATLWHLVDHVGDTMRRIEAHAIALPLDARVAFAARPEQSLLARDCGFEPETFRCAAINVMSTDAPSSAIVHFSTALQDGYISFSVTLDDAQVGPISVCFS